MRPRAKREVSYGVWALTDDGWVPWDEGYLTRKKANDVRAACENEERRWVGVAAVARVSSAKRPLFAVVKSTHERLEAAKR